MSGAAKNEPVSFSVDLLFSEPLHFELGEIIEAVKEDYPSCQIMDCGYNPSQSLKTDDVLLAILKPVESHDAESIKMIGIGYPDENFRNADHTETYWRSCGFGQEAMAKHQSYVNLSVTPSDDTLAARFRAARTLSVVAAVFAKLPITMAVYVKWSGQLVDPEHWVKATDMAIKGDWPLTAWLAYRAGWDMHPDRSKDHSVAYTIGLSQFLPYELHMESAPMPPSDARNMLAAAVWMPLQGGNVYNDGDSVGIEGDIRYTIRHRKSADGSPTGIYVLLHPNSPIDEESEFGKRPSIPTPLEEPYIRRPKRNFMQRILGRN